MLVVTTDSLPGYEIREVLGEVIGVTARTHNPFAEGIKSLHGGTNPRMMESLTRWREEAVERMAQEALRRGANAVVGMRFDHREITSAWVEICAYGTAAVVAVRPAVERAPVPAGAQAMPARTHPSSAGAQAMPPRTQAVPADPGAVPADPGAVPAGTQVVAGGPAPAAPGG